VSVFKLGDAPAQAPVQTAPAKAASPDKAKTVAVRKVQTKPAANKPLAAPKPKLVNAKSGGADDWEEF
ncbi:MAG TPA: methyl-accepting chemotaxis protein, partial [Burkholderiales bacterium]|nr:methyl-accepting chemotaxis protein [Burkholderiales bacterium]